MDDGATGRVEKDSGELGGQGGVAAKWNREIKQAALHGKGLALGGSPERQKRSWLDALGNQPWCHLQEVERFCLVDGNRL